MAASPFAPSVGLLEHEWHIRFVENRVDSHVIEISGIRLIVGVLFTHRKQSYLGVRSQVVGPRASPHPRYSIATGVGSIDFLIGSHVDTLHDTKVGPQGWRTRKRTTKEGTSCLVNVFLPELRLARFKDRNMGQPDIVVVVPIDQ